MLVTGSNPLFGPQWLCRGQLKAILCKNMKRRCRCFLRCRAVELRALQGSAGLDTLSLLCAAPKTNCGQSLCAVGARGWSPTAVCAGVPGHRGTCRLMPARCGDEPRVCPSSHRGAAAQAAGARALHPAFVWAATSCCLSQMCMGCCSRGRALGMLVLLPDLIQRGVLLWKTF